MRFDRLLGNEQLKENLSRSIQSGRISHFYLICGPEGSGRHTLARLLAAAVLCQDTAKPCLRCTPCRKLLENNHPDFITVEDPEHKNVAVKIVRQFREDVFIRPNESDHKIYFLPQELGIEGQNALLKILEEPPQYGVFILLTDNPEKLLPTVRSRCTELLLRPLDPRTLQKALRERFPKATDEDLAAAASRSGGFLGQAIRLMTDGGPEGSTMVLVYYIYHQAFKMFNTGYASAIAVVLFIIVALISVLQAYFTSRKEVEL